MELFSSFLTTRVIIDHLLHYTLLNAFIFVTLIWNHIDVIAMRFILKLVCLLFLKLVCRSHRKSLGRVPGQRQHPGRKAADWIWRDFSTATAEIWFDGHRSCFLRVGFLSRLWSRWSKDLILWLQTCTERCLHFQDCRHFLLPSILCCF